METHLLWFYIKEKLILKHTTLNKAQSLKNLKADKSCLSKEETFVSAK